VVSKSWRRREPLDNESGQPCDRFELKKLIAAEHDVWVPALFQLEMTTSRE
jgi:hypothetical protein